MLDKLTMYCEYVPQFIAKPSIHDMLKYKVTICYGNSKAVFSYNMGLGHIKDYYKRFFSSDKYLTVNGQKELSKLLAGEYELKHVIPFPELKDVVTSLVLDSGVLNCSSFGQWCIIYGYDEDSRKAFNMYQACVEQTIQFVSLVGLDGLIRLRDEINL